MNHIKHSFKSWPFQEADRIVHAAARGSLPEVAVFETGYGPSGLPHIGTFAEVARTTWVRHAYEHLTGRPSMLVAFSDDLDGLRKVPENIPNPELVAPHLGKPLSSIPDPFGCCPSYSAHMNGKLREFLDAFGFEYEFRSSTEAYRRGDFNAGIKILLDRVEQVLEVILPTLKEENRPRWSPFLPRCENCGRVYTTRVTAHLKEREAVEYACDTPFGEVAGCGHRGAVSVYDGAVKMGWKVDWALRWFCYGVHYEMYGKDLIPSAELSAKVVKVMGGRPPHGFSYELFLDEAGEKISKSRGNGVSVEQWMAYAPVDSLSYFIFRDPRAAKKLYFEMIPRTMDEYLDHVRRFGQVPEEKRPDNPLWHIHQAGRAVPAYASTINFGLVNNLLAALGTADHELLRRYLVRYDPEAARFPEMIDSLIDKGIRFYQDHILPHKRHRPPTPPEKPLFAELRRRLAGMAGGELDEKAAQSMVFDIAREHGADPAEFFSAIYQVLLGQERGPRFGSFAKLVGAERVLHLLDQHA